MSDLPIRIVKVGGSLFGLPDLPERLQNWLVLQASAWNILIAGGGPLVDRLRQMDHSRPIGEKACHWLAIDLMDIAARMLGAWLPEIPVVIDTTTPTATSVILAPGRFLREKEPDLPGVTLPASWDVTSDSIAARLAVVHGASELVLLKSVDPPVPIKTLNALSKAGHVDGFFPHVARSVPSIRFENLAHSPRSAQVS